MTIKNNHIQSSISHTYGAFIYPEYNYTADLSDAIQDELELFKTIPSKSML